MSVLGNYKILHIFIYFLEFTLQKDCTINWNLIDIEVLISAIMYMYYMYASG